MGQRLALGIDIGGTGIKHAVVDVMTGELVSDRVRLATPRPADPGALIAVARDALQAASGHAIEAVGVAFPAVVQRGCALTAVNIAPNWQYVDVAQAFSKGLERDVSVLNDGDAAGLAEVRFGAGQGVSGKVVVVTLGTGVGTSLFSNGQLVPNLELGRLYVRGRPADERASNSVRKRKRLAWREWAKDVEAFVRELDMACWPELIIVGGGVSKDAHRWLPFVACRPALAPARLRNDAGIVGAALFASEQAVI